MCKKESGLLFRGPFRISWIL